MSEKYYRVKQDNFMWEKGAILKRSENLGSKDSCYGYEPINDLYNAGDNQTEYISGYIIESRPEWFERVYPVNLVTKTVYKLKEEAKELFSKEHVA